MFGFLKKRRQDKAYSMGQAVASTLGSLPRTPSGFHRELVRGVFSEMLRSQGIAPEILVFDIVPLRRLTGEKEWHIQIIMVQWNPAVLQLAPQLQQHMQRELAAYASPADISSFVVEWRFSPACIHASAQRPAPVAPAPQVAPAPAPQVAPAPAQDHEIAIFRERQFAPAAATPPTLDASLFASTTKFAYFPATEVHPLE